MGIDNSFCVLESPCEEQGRDESEKGLVNGHGCSICIPKMDIQIQKKFVYYAFERFLGKDTIERIDMVVKKDKRGGLFKRGFIHLKCWKNNEHHCHIQNILLRGDCFHLVYDIHYNYWKCFMSRSPKPYWNLC